MIIALAGRMGSGKTLLASELINKGFVKVAFADYLKELISKIYNFNISLLKSDYGKTEKLSLPLIWDQTTSEKLFFLAGIFNYNTPIIRKEFYSRRELMQYIGTDILRNYDNNFHINKTLESLDFNKNYIFDDFRFVNELQALKEIGAICYFIIRPNNFIISNHLSETSLNWTMFDSIIINDIPENKIKSDFLNSIKYINYTSKKRTNHIVITRDSLVHELKLNNFNTTLVSNIFKCSRNKIVWWSKKFLIDLPHVKYSHDKSAFLFPTKESAYYAGLLSADGCIKQSGKSKLSYVLELFNTDYELVNGFKNYIKSNKPIYIKKRKPYKDGYTLIINCPFIIENLKFWNLKPLKSKNNEIPDIIKDNIYLINMWTLGLIDGDGSVFLCKKNTYPCISVLASKQIIDFLQLFYSDIKSCIYQEKNIDNLYKLQFNGRNAILLYKRIYDPIALDRKWNKLLSFK